MPEARNLLAALQLSLKQRGPSPKSKSGLQVGPPDLEQYQAQKLISRAFGSGTRYVPWVFQEGYYNLIAELRKSSVPLGGQGLVGFSALQVAPGLALLGFRSQVHCFVDRSTSYALAVA